MLNFRECTLAQLDNTFGVQQVIEHPALQQWLTSHATPSDFERQSLLYLQDKLKVHVHDWNEIELAYSFIGPVMALVDYTSAQFNFFAERMLRGTVEGIDMGGKPDGMIASGFRQPATPYFCFHEYKRDEDPEGDSAGQALAAMLVAQVLNEHHHPIYGCYVKGRDWFFMVLHGKQYAISEPYIATRDDVFDIFRILKALKAIIADLVAQDASPHYKGAESSA